MIRIEYSNVCDLDNVLFSAGYVQNIYLDVEEMFAPEYEYFEDGTEDRNRNFIPSFKKQTKRQVFRVMATPYMAECLQNIPLCKSITIEINGEINKCELFSCSIADTVNKGKYYLMECSYQVDQIISTGCCSNIRPTECLQTNVDDVLDIIDCDSDEFTDPQNNITEDSRYLVDFSNCESKLAQGYNIEIMVYSVSRGEWGHSQDNAPNNYVYNVEDDLYYYYINDTFVEVPTLDVPTLVAGTTYNFTGNALPNTFVELYKDSVATGEKTTSAQYMGSGIEYDAQGGGDFTINNYTHNCEYGFSSEQTIEGYEAETTALFNRMSDFTDKTDYKIAANTFIKSLKDDGIWNNLDVMHVYAFENGTDALLNWIKDDHNGTAVNAPTFTANEGYTGNGSSAYIDMNFIPSTDGVNYSQDDAGILVKTETSTTGVTTMTGVADVTNTVFLGSLSATEALLRFNSNVFATLTPTTFTADYYYLERNNASDIDYYYGATSILNTALVSSGLPSTSAAVFSYNDNSVYKYFSSTKISVVLYGAALGSTDYANFKTAFNQYLIDIAAI